VPSRASEKGAVGTVIFVLAILVLIGAVVGIVAYLATGNHAGVLWFNYAWSSDKGNGPEAIQQTIIYAAIAALIYPPSRKAVERWIERHKDDLKRDRQALDEKASAERQELDRKLSHIIKYHPGIPDIEEKA
jgi:ABC-type Fe3+ transport system permease subunit